MRKEQQQGTGYSGSGGVKTSLATVRCVDKPEGGRDAWKQCHSSVERLRFVVHAQYKVKKSR